MEPIIAEKNRVRIIAEIDPKLAHKLKREKADTDKPIRQIVEEALLRHLATEAPTTVT
jgi:hypothetical protein